MNDAAIDAAALTSELVAQLVAEQFPAWAELPVRPVALSGNDHRMFRLGDALTARLPSHAGYIPQVAKEEDALPRLAPHVPLPIPVRHGRGRPSALFPAPWSVLGWIDGTPLSAASVDDEDALAGALADFLRDLRAAPAAGGPAPGPHSAFRGGPVAHWDDEVQALLPQLSGRERDAAAGMWRDAVAAPFSGPAVWVHGDVAAGNLLVRDGRLAAVLDFGCAAVGDPACDTVPRWTFLAGGAAARFTRELGVDDATWARGRGWALWKALIMLSHTVPGQAEFARRVLDALFADR